MKVVLVGATGFIGQELGIALRDLCGDDVEPDISEIRVR